MADRVKSWLFDLRPDEDRLGEYMLLLSLDERLRAEQIRYRGDRVAFVARRGQLRQMLAAYLGLAPELLFFDQNEFGKPALRDGDDLRFNTSSSGDIGLGVIARGIEVGCDIERRDPAKASIGIAERFFAPDERSALAGLPANQWLEGFFNCWTRKEALLKCLGCGLSGELSAFTVSLAPGAPATIFSHTEFVVASFRSIPDYQMAIVANSTDPLTIDPPLWWGGELIAHRALANG